MGNNVRDKYANRLDDSDDGTDAESSETDENSNEDRVKDDKGVLMYLDEDRARELSLLYDELNLKHKRVNETDEDLGKSRRYYRTIVDVALNHRDEIEDELL